MNARHIASLVPTTRSPFYTAQTVKPTEMVVDRQPAAVAVSKVLDDDDLLIEILLCVGFPTTLVRASLVCKRWLGRISDRAFLRRFRELHPPRLLGFYIRERSRSVAPQFIPVLPQPPELATVIRRASFSLDTYKSESIRIHDCRDGSVFITLYDRWSGRACRVHSPLCPGRVAILPPLPRNRPPSLEDPTLMVFCQVFSKEEEANGLSYLYVVSTVNIRKSRCSMHVYTLQDGSWRAHYPLAIGQLPHCPLFGQKAVLVGDKIYIPSRMDSIIVMDLMTLIFSNIQLPQGVEHGESVTTMLSRASDASGIYLIHVKDFELRIWLYKEDNWLLVDTLFLCDMYPNLRMLGCTVEDKLGALLIKQAGDDAEFVLLQLGRCAFHLDTRRKTLHKVYEQTAADQYFGDIHPFMMIWPPTFPMLKDAT